MSSLRLLPGDSRWTFVAYMVLLGCCKLWARRVDDQYSGLSGLGDVLGGNLALRLSLDSADGTALRKLLWEISSV